MYGNFLHERIELLHLQTLRSVLSVFGSDIPRHARYAGVFLLSALQNHLNSIAFSFLCHREVDFYLGLQIYEPSPVITNAFLLFYFGYHAVCAKTPALSHSSTLKRRALVPFGPVFQKMAPKLLLRLALAAHRRCTYFNSGSLKLSSGLGLAMAASMSLTERGAPADRFSQPLSVMSTSSSMRTPMPHHFLSQGLPSGM